MQPANPAWANATICGCKYGCNLFKSINKHYCLIINKLSDMVISMQVAWLFLLAIPIACVAWTVTHEEVFREPREYCLKRCKQGKTIAERKFFYLFTCEYCFSHYVTVAFLFLTNYKLLMDDWRGYIIAGFALVWIANMYMSLYGLLRQGISVEKAEVEVLKNQAEK
jgi:hypothetical protein